MSSLTRSCLEEVNNKETHWLSFAERRRMLLSLGPTWQSTDLQIIDVVEGRYEMTIGHRRRAHLAILAATRVAAFWERRFSEPHPQRLIANAQKVLEGSLDKEVLRVDAIEFKGTGLDGGAPPDRDGYGFLWAGYAGAFAAFTTVWDEDLLPDDNVTQGTLDNPDDPDLWDCAAWAAAAWAGGFPWGEAEWYHPERALEFWLWYLNEAVPKAIELAG